MNALEVPQHELDAARKFLGLASTEREWPATADNHELTLRRADLIRLMAWYGAIRGRHGTYVVSFTATDDGSPNVEIRTEEGKEGSGTAGPLPGDGTDDKLVL